MLIGGVFVLVGTFPAAEIPDFKTAGAADEGDLAHQLEFFAKVIREHKAALFIRGAMLRAGVQLPLENAGVPRGEPGRRHRRGPEARKFVWRHHEEALEILLGQEDELFRFAIAPPARRNGHTVLAVDLMTKIPGEEMRR